MRWLGTACFEIYLPNQKTMIIDPYVDDSVSSPISSDQFEGCDYIFITHGHYDHVLDTGKLAKQFNPIIYCSKIAAEALIKHLGVDSALIQTISAGDVIREDGMIVEVVPGLHVDFAAEYRRLTGHDMPIAEEDPFTAVKKAVEIMFETDWLPPQFKEWMVKFPQGEQLNYVFELSGGPRIYMAGTRPDRSLINVAERARADITLLQVLPGNTLTGMEELTADMAIASGCRVVVPQHHDRLLEGAKETDLTEFKRLLATKSDIVVQEFVPGKWYEFA